MTGRSGRRVLISRNKLSPSIPGMLMSDRMTISSGLTPFDSLSSASSPELAKHLGDIGLVVDDEDAEAHAVISEIASLRSHRRPGSLRGAERRSNLVKA